MSIETKAQLLSDAAHPASGSGGEVSTLTLAEAISRRQAAFAANESIALAFSESSRVKDQMTEAHEAAVAEREIADFHCASIKFFYKRMESLIGRRDDHTRIANCARDAMLAAGNEADALEAGRRMLAAERIIAEVTAEAATECQRICELVGVENDMLPNPFWSWHKRAFSKVATERRNAAVQAAGVAKANLQTAEEIFHRAAAAHSEALQQLQAADRLLEEIARRQLAEESQCGHSIQPEPDIAPASE